MARDPPARSPPVPYQSNDGVIERGVLEPSVVIEKILSGIDLHHDVALVIAGIEGRRKNCLVEPGLDRVDGLTESDESPDGIHLSLQ